MVFHHSRKSGAGKDMSLSAGPSGPSGSTGPTGRLPACPEGRARSAQLHDDLYGAERARLDPGRCHYSEVPDLDDGVFDRTWFVIFLRMRSR